MTNEKDLSKALLMIDEALDARQLNEIGLSLEDKVYRLVEHMRYLAWKVEDLIELVDELEEDR